MPEENNPQPKLAENSPMPPTSGNTEPQPIEVMPVRQLKVLFIWKAPLRPFKRRDKEFWTTVLAIIFLLSLILFLAGGQFMLIAVIVSLAFVYYVLSTVPPEEIEYRITNKGVSFEEKSYDWDLLWRFWFSDKYSQRLLNIDTRLSLPGRLIFVIKKEDEQKIKEIMEKYLLNEEAEPTFFDRASAWLAKKVPLDLEKKEETTVSSTASPTPPSTTTPNF